VLVCCRFEDTGEEYSLCSWNLDSIKGYSVRANRNSSVLIEFNVKAGFNRICPAVKVVTNVMIGDLQACPRDIAVRDYLPLRAAGAQRVGTETCGRVGSQGRTVAYAFRVNSPARTSRGMCAALTVETSDDIVQELLLRYID
jgi:hypothetical protein